MKQKEGGGGKGSEGWRFEDGTNKDGMDGHKGDGTGRESKGGGG